MSIAVLQISFSVSVPATGKWSWSTPIPCLRPTANPGGVSIFRVKFLLPTLLYAFRLCTWLLSYPRVKYSVLPISEFHFSRKNFLQTSNIQLHYLPRFLGSIWMNLNFSFHLCLRIRMFKSIYSLVQNENFTYIISATASSESTHTNLCYFQLRNFLQLIRNWYRDSLLM